VADERRRLGDRGEAAVARAMARRGYAVLERQYRCRWGEIDIVARDPAGTLCFVEVKTRTSGGFAQPREAVTPAKQRKLRAAASLYLAERRLDCRCRFDVAEVYWTSRRINYIINAF